MLPTDFHAVNPQNLNQWLSQIRDLDELKAFIDGLRALEDAGSTLNERNYWMSLRIPALDLYGTWQQNQILFAVKYEDEQGWHSNALIVPAENYTGRSADPSEYARRLIAMYGGLSDQDKIDRNNQAAAARAAQEAAAKAAETAALALAKKNAAAAAAASAAAAATVAQAATAVQNNPSQQNVQNLNQSLNQSAAADANHQAATSDVQSMESGGSAGIVKLLGLALTLWSFSK